MDPASIPQHIPVALLDRDLGPPIGIDLRFRDLTKRHQFGVVAITTAAYTNPCHLGRTWRDDGATAQTALGAFCSHFGEAQQSPLPVASPLLRKGTSLCGEEEHGTRYSPT